MAVLIIGAGLVGSQVAKILVDAGERPLVILYTVLSKYSSLFLDAVPKSWFYVIIGFCPWLNDD
jgi:saccharopine dehydrogenase-like NADP-dependent oxidoreductase